MKKMISLLLSILMLLSITAGLDFSAFADELTSGQCGENVYYDFDSETGTLTISGSGPMTNYYSNGSVFYDNNSIINIVIEYGVTTIGDYSFQVCSNLTNVEIPDTVTSIGYSAFAACSGLTSIIIPNSVTSIDSYSFGGCTSLKNISISSNITEIGAYSFFNTAYYNDGSNWDNDVLYIGNYLIKAEDSISGTYRVKEGTRVIAAIAFQLCSWLKSVIMPDSVISIGEAAFAECSGLTSFNIPINITTIGSHTFEKCSSLTSIIIPDGVTNIGWEAFYDCYKLTTITIPDSVTNIGEYAFVNTAYYNNENNWEDNVLYIGRCLIEVKNGMSGCYNIKDGTKVIADKAFYNCNGLVSIMMPNSITNIGDYAFEECTGLTNITIPSNVTIIRESTFEECIGLTTITIPTSVTSIDKSAFAYCENLTDVYYLGSKSQWEGILIAKRGSSYLLNANIHYSISDETIDEIIYSGDDEIRVQDYTEHQTFCEYVDSLNSTTYDPYLSYMLAGLSRAAYNKTNIKNSYLSLGFEDYDTYNYGENSYNAASSIGKKKLDNGTSIVLITIRGTDKKYIKNLISDFNCFTVGLNQGNHYGFNSCADTVFNNLKAFMDGNIQKTNVKYIITGHSLGAATGNLLAVKLSEAGVPNSNVYSYNYACPDVARGDGSNWNPNGVYDNIFNLGCAKDIVSEIPGWYLYFSLIPGGETWGKYGRSYWFSKDWTDKDEISIDLDFSFKYHDMKNYVNYLSKFKGLEDFKSWNELHKARIKAATGEVHKYVFIAGIYCPVNVAIYDSNNNLVASVVNNELVSYEIENDDILVFIEDDHKYIVFPNDKNYSIQLTGTDVGTMTYSLIKADLDTQETEAQKTFSDIELTNGKEMQTASIANADVENTELYVIENENAVAEITTDGEEIAIEAGWHKIFGKWYYYDSNGNAVRGWQKIKNTWYYMDINGVMQTGWQKVGSTWYYFKSSGAMVTGWQKIGSVWYYFKSSGAMATGWLKDGGKWYYLQSSGAMATGWVKVSGKWYYMQSSGAMKTGWLKDGGKWYYLESSGAMLANTSKKINGKTYKFNSSGVCTNP